MPAVYINTLGVYAPGLLGWEQTRLVLTGEQVYHAEEPPKLAPEVLPPAMRRRTGDDIRVAVQVAHEAVRQTDIDPSSLATVFATSGGEGKIADAICRAVNEEVPMVSPTMFHNSVINAPAGYWCMAVNAQQPSTSMAGHDASFAVGLVEAVLQVCHDGRDLLLIAHDVPLPEPLHSKRSMVAKFGVALLLTRKPTRYSRATLDIELGAALQDESVMSEPELEVLRRGNPAARSLPLLAHLARGTSAHLVLPYIDQQTLGLELNLL